MKLRKPSIPVASSLSMGWTLGFRRWLIGCALWNSTIDWYPCLYPAVQRVQLPLPCSFILMWQLTNPELRPTFVYVLLRLWNVLGVSRDLSELAWRRSEVTVGYKRLAKIAKPHDAHHPSIKNNTPYIIPPILVQFISIWAYFMALE